MAERGNLTPLVSEAAKRLLGRPISRAELRLMPYVQYLIINGEGVSRRKVNEEEINILLEWESAGYIIGLLSPRLTCGHYFWGVMSELLWMAYADHENQPNDPAPEYPEIHTFDGVEYVKTSDFDALKDASEEILGDIPEDIRDKVTIRLDKVRYKWTR